ncbi:MAG: S66 peptidase family protein [Omnitrophica WOR_2 bacterium]
MKREEWFLPFFFLPLAEIIDQMITPPFLKQGDTIAIASPARKISLEELKPAISMFEAWGLNVHISPELFSIDNQFAGTDYERCKYLQQLLDNPEIKAIVCARGGYGTMRIIDNIDFTLFKSSPKWIIGYSDITVLHSHIQKHCEIETLHATMPVNLLTESLDNNIAFENLRKCLFGETPHYKIKGSIYNRKGNAKGVLTGGNLSILYSLIGSSSDVDLDGKILFIEDVDEYLYHIDRMMISLKRSGKLDSLAGLIVGSFKDMHDNETPFGSSVEEIIQNAVKEYKYPVIFGFPAGHIPLNQPLIFGREITLEVNEDSQIVFHEPSPLKGIRRIMSFIKPIAYVLAGFILLYLLYSLILGKF